MKLQDNIDNMILFVVKRKREIYKCVCAGNFQKDAQESIKRADLCGNVTQHLGWGKRGVFIVL